MYNKFNKTCYLSTRKPKLSDSIIKKEGIVGLLDEVKSVANLNDPASNALKLCGLKMINSLLNNPNNLDEFLKSDGVDLINEIIKNDINNKEKEKKVKKILLLWNILQKVLLVKNSWTIKRRKKIRN